MPTLDQLKAMGLISDEAMEKVKSPTEFLNPIPGTPPMAGYGRVIPGMNGDRTIGGGLLNDPPGPRELASDIFQSNSGKLTSSLKQLDRMRSGGRHPYNADELDITEGHLRDLATKPFVSRSAQDQAAMDAEDAANPGTSSGVTGLDMRSAGAVRKR